MRYWIVVVSKDHIVEGVAGGFIQSNHGKPGSLKRMAAIDWVITYSPKAIYKLNEPLQAFTAIGQVADEEIYQYHMPGGFTPYRRNMNYHPCTETPIAPLIDRLDFITNKKSWGYRFRFGFFEIQQHDFELIRAQMMGSK